MKTEIKIKSFSHEDLVNLIATGIVDSSYLGIKYDKKVYEDLPDRDEDDFLEDKCARVLLGGGGVRVTDYQAEGCVYDGAGLPHADDADENVIYTLRLENIISGLEKAAGGTFTPSGGDDANISAERKFVREAFDELSLGDDGCLDSDQADVLW